MALSQFFTLQKPCKFGIFQVLLQIFAFIALAYDQELETGLATSKQLFLDVDQHPDILFGTKPADRSKSYNAVINGAF